ncbi:MAG: geranylgeranyl reductase family protein [Bacteroidota bacterium]|nr:geranylgeranyl reductase family protein [Bacteroidota bacterium]
MKEFDVLIIGGGPSGALTGIELQKRGFNTCIIDKASFPREKLCGGGLTLKTIELLDTYCPELDKNAFILGQSDNVDFYYKTDQITHTKINTPYFFTDRKLLDASLIELYKEKGGTLLENTRINAKDINFAENTILLGNDSLRYKYLIGACGCSTLLTKPFGISRNDYFCVETRVAKETTEKQPFRIYLGPVQNGYGWYFPKNDHDVIGVGGKNTNKTLPKQAELFFQEVTKTTGLPSKGAFIPSGKKINALSVTDNTILVGDAAGFIDPITGEGLYYALLSGIFASESVLEASGNPKRSLQKIYTCKCSKIKKNMKWGYLYHKVLHADRVTPYFIKALQNHPHFVKYYLEDVISTYRFNYKNFIWTYFTKIRKSLHAQ